jgi:hypothetical protein
MLMEPGPSGSGDDLRGQRAVCLRQPQRRDRANQAAIRRPIFTGNQRGQPVPCLVTSGPMPWQHGGRHQLATLASAGFIDRRHDLLLDRRPVVTVADPMVRFHQLVIEPYLADLEAGRAGQVWAEAERTVESKIFGPHFEALAADWVARYAPRQAGLTIGPVGQTVIACREHKVGHEIDILALVRGSRPRTPGTPVAFVGKAKHRDRRPGLAELRRLQHLRDLLTAAGHDASDAIIGVFSTAGFTDDLAAEATASRGKILLATLGELYDQQS